MGRVHQLPKQRHIPGLQGLHCPDGTPIFINRVLCPFSAHVVLDGRLIFFKRLFIQISQTVDFYRLLQLRQRSLALAAALIVLGIPQAPLLIAAGNDDLCPLQSNGRIGKGQICRIQKDGIIFLSHGNGKLIHDAAVHFVIIILGILSDKRQFLVAHLESEKVS